jgi:hypothetical protein
MSMLKTLIVVFLVYKNHYISEHGMHWNIEGHIEAAKLIEKFINERYN